MDKKVSARDASRARWAYETLAKARGWVRDDGSKIPQWDELSLNAQWKCGSVIDVLLYGTKQKERDE